MPRPKVTHDELLDLLDYDKDTGHFRWKKGKGRAVEGAIAGTTISLDKRQITIKGISYLEHQLAWFYAKGAWAENVYHLNDDGLDNRLVNLTDKKSAKAKVRRVRERHEGAPSGEASLLHSDLVEALRYDPETGRFFWKVRCGNKRPGQRAGADHKFNGRKITIDGYAYSEARLAWFYMNGKWPIGRVLHRNKAHNDNRWANLYVKAAPLHEKRSQVQARSASLAWLTAP